MTSFLTYAIGKSSLHRALSRLQRGSRRWIWGLLLTLCPGMLWASTNVPLGYWGYDVLERWEAKGLISSARLGSRPLSRIEMAEWINKVMRERPPLDPTEWGELSRLQQEFGEELLQIGTGLIRPKRREPGMGRVRRMLDGGPLAMWQEVQRKIRIDYVGRIRGTFHTGDTYDSTEKIYQRTSGARIRGDFERFSFYVEARDTQEYGTRTYQERSDVFETGVGYVTLKRGRASYDETIAYLVWKLPWFHLELGKDDLRWGPGYRGTLILSDYGPSFDMIKLKARYGQFTFTSVTGFLRSTLVDSVRSIRDHGQLKALPRQKYLTAHRLEISLSHRADLGLTEMVIYGDRGLEWTYINPIMFYWSGEHHLGDQDNALMAFDLSVRIAQGLQGYGTFLIDDLTKSKLGTDWYGNKFAYLGGLFWVDPMGLRDTDLRLEVARIDPWVYTHRFAINAYTNYNWPLGHWLGPNADDLFAEVRHRFAPNVEIALWAEQERHGRNESERDVGEDLYDGWQEGDSEHKSFLSGIVEKTRRYGLRATYEILPNLLLRVEAQQMHSENVPVGEDLRGNLTTNQFSMGLTYNYW